MTTSREPAGAMAVLTPTSTGREGVESTIPAWEPPPSIGSRGPAPTDEAVRLSLRLVVELVRRPPPPDGGTARWESTQQGLAERLSVTQGAVSKVLARLVAAKVVHHERCHVGGVARRVRVYFLTRQGEALAREICGRFGLVPPLPPSGDARGDARAP